ncbi:MAG: glycosyltransferase family 4 protein [Acidobacteria bacterium]|nr:glycosyltransferase family 4 protein [Acidobacteriota bacterium]
MNIACDARALAGQLTGVGRWTAQVLGGLAAGYGHRVLLASPRPVTLPPALELPAVRTLPPARIAVPGTLWLHTVLPAILERDRPDIFIASLAIVPRRCPVPAVAVIHDLTPRTHPRRHTLANRFCFNAYLEESLERAEAVVAVSSATARRLIGTFGWVRPKLHVIPNGVEDRYAPPGEGDGGDAVRERFSGGRPYLLHLGTLEPRKGLLTLVDAWERLRLAMPDAPDLVLAGAWGWNTGPLRRRIEASRFAPALHVAGYVTDEDAIALLQHAEVFAAASEEEGFGLPLAEAICCGAACVATRIPAFEETARGAALHTPPGDPEAMAGALARALEPDATAGLRRRARERARTLRWPPAIAAWNELLLGVVSSSAPPR